MIVGSRGTSTGCDGGRVRLPRGMWIRSQLVGGRENCQFRARKRSRAASVGNRSCHRVV